MLVSGTLAAQEATIAPAASAKPYAIFEDDSAQSAPVINNNGTNVTPTIARKIIVLSDFSRASHFQADIQFMLVRGAMEALGQSKHNFRIFESALPVTGEKVAENLPPEYAKADTLILLTFRSSKTSTTLSADIAAFKLPARSPLFELKLPHITPDARYRNLGLEYWTPLVDLADQHLAPIADTRVLQVKALPGSIATIMGKEYRISDTGIVEVPFPSGRKVEVELRKEGTFKIRETIYLNEGMSDELFVWEPVQEKYVNPFYLEANFIWLRFPSARIGLPIIEEHLYVPLGFQFYGIGLATANKYETNPTLLVDYKLLEVGGGIHWYINSRFADFRVYTGLELFLRINMIGAYFLDALNPAVAQLNLGAEIQLTKNTWFYFQLNPRYMFSQDPLLATYGSLRKSKDSSDSSNKNMEDIFNAKIIAGPGVFEPVVPTIGIRVQL